MTYDKYKLSFLNTIYFMAGAVAFFMGFVRIENNFYLGVADFVFSIICFGLLYYLKGHKEKIELLSTVAITLCYFLFTAIYIIATDSENRASLYFTLLASAIFLKSGSAGKTWLVIILGSLWIPKLSFFTLPSYSILDTITTSVYLIVFYYIFGHYRNIQNMQKEKLFRLNANLNSTVEKKTKELQNANDELVRLSETDTLTKIPNRRFYNQKITENISSAKRTGQPLSMLMIDIDYFKNYNDGYGHDMGDNVLKRVAESINETLIRATDSVSRFGGEEFIVLLPTTDNDGAYIIAERIRTFISATSLPNIHSETENIITVSIGIASLESDELNEADLFKHADSALYMAKDKGRNQSVIFSA